MFTLYLNVHNGGASKWYTRFYINYQAAIRNYTREKNKNLKTKDGPVKRPKNDKNKTTKCVRTFRERNRR